MVCFSIGCLNRDLRNRNMGLYGLGLQSRRRVDLTVESPASRRAIITAFSTDDPWPMDLEEDPKIPCVTRDTS